MPHDVQSLLKMSQAELDALFSSVPAGPIPDGEAEGTAIIAPGTTYSSTIAKFISTFAWQGKVFDRSNSVLRNKILPFGINAIIATLQDAPESEMRRNEVYHVRNSSAVDVANALTTYFGNIMVLNAHGISGLNAYYCEGPGFNQGVVPGRLGADLSGSVYRNPFGNGGRCDQNCTASDAKTVARVSSSNAHEARHSAVQVSWFGAQ